MGLENLKLEIEKKKNKSEEKFYKYLDKENLPCTFNKSDLEEVRKNVYEEVLNMITKEQEKERKEALWEEENAYYKEDREWFLDCVKNDSNFNYLFDKVIRKNLACEENKEEDAFEYLISKIKNYTEDEEEFAIVDEIVCAFTSKGISGLLDDYCREKRTYEIEESSQMDLEER